MVMKNCIILALFCCLIASQEWITPAQHSTTPAYLQTEQQQPKNIPQISQSQNEVQQSNAHTQQSKEDKGLYIEQRVEQVQKPRNPFDRSDAEPKVTPKNMENMSDDQIKQHLETNKDQFREHRDRRDRKDRREGAHNRGPQKQFKRKYENHPAYNMQMLCMIGSTAVGTALLCLCVKKCKKHSKRSMEKMMRRREMARFQQIVPPQVYMPQPIHTETINSAQSFSIDTQIRFHQIQLQKLKQLNEQRNQVHFQDRRIPVGQPLYQANMMRAQNYRY